MSTVQGHEANGGASKRGAPDPSVVLPPAVRAAAERSEALVKQAKEMREAAPAGNDQPIGESLKLTPVSNGNGSTSVVVQSFDPNNPNPPREIALASPAPAPGPATQPSDMEHQLRSMQGRLNKEAEDRRRMAAQLTDTQRLLAQLSVAPSTPPAATEGSGVRFGAPPKPGKLVTDKERAEYGDELLDVIARRAQETYEPIINQLTGELNQIKQQVGSVRSTAAFDTQVKMYEVLAREVPNWDAINNSAAFAQWLDQLDPYTGTLRRNLLLTAHNTNATNRVVAIFRGFLADDGASQFRPAIVDPQPGQGNNPPRVDLAKFAAPGKAKPGQTQVPVEKPIFNAADIPQFYRDKTAGKYAGREAEADALERALFEAGKEGRIHR